jgi:type IV secretion system protein VirB2
MVRVARAKINSIVRRIASIIRRIVLALFGSGIAIAVTAPNAWAGTGGAGMPWDAPLTNLMNNLAGPTARALTVIAIVGCGLVWALTHNEAGLRRLGQVAFGGAIAMGAVVMMASLGFAGAVL